MGAEPLQPEPLDDRVLRLQGGEGRVGAAALGDGVDDEVLADLAVYGLRVLGEQLRGRARFEQRPTALE